MRPKLKKRLIFCTAFLCSVWNLFAFVPFQAGDGGWQMAAPAVGNIDSDRALEIVLAYRNSNGQWLLDAYKPSGARVSGFPFTSGTSPINVSPTLYDLDGDGASEILFTAGNSIVALRGNGTVLWKQDVTPLNYIPDGGFHAVTNAFYLSNLSLPIPNLPATAQFFSEVSSPIVVDLEGDGTKKVLTAWKIDPDSLTNAQDYNPFFNDIFGLTEWGATGEEWSGGVIVSDAQTGQKRFIYHFHQLVEAGLGLAQLDSDRAVEVLVLNDADSVVAFDKTQAPGLFGKGMLHKKFGKNLRLLSGSYLTGVDVHAADIDGDGLDEVLVASTQINPNWQPSDSLLDDDGALMWRKWKQPASVQNVFGWFNNATLIPVNPEHDNHIDVLGFSHSPEITFRTWNGVQLVDRPGWPKNFGSFLPTPPVVGDVDGDGQEEIVIGTYDPAHNPSSGKLLVFALDGTQKYSIDVAGGVKHIPTIADVDQDGRTEVVLRSLEGKIYILTFGNGGSEQNISWATHRGNAQRNGNFGRNLYPVGTPIVTFKSGGFRRATFSWRLPAGQTPIAIKIARASDPNGPFTEIATLPPNIAAFADGGLDLWAQYVYEVRAVYGSTVASSAPFVILSEVENNLIVNGGFEQDDNSHWDKWFTGEIPWTNMTSSADTPQGGRQSMQIRLQNHGNNSTITQYSHYGLPEDYLPVTPGTLYSFGGFIRTTGLTQNSEHWFEWDSSRTGENTNARPSLPWPNYFTPSLRAGTASTAWTYLNRVFQMPDGFPNVELRHRYTIAAPGSGSVFIDNVFFRPLPPADDAQWTHWIPFGSRWRYNTTVPGSAWSDANFNDSAWAEAPAKFGQGYGPRNIVTPLPANLPAYYFRRTFYAAAGARELLLAATCTDDYGGKVYPLRIWLNGSEVPTGGIEAVSGDGNTVKYFDLSPFLSMIRPGANTIAVMLNNTWQPGWDDVALDISLRAIPQPINDFESASIDSVNFSTDGAVTLRLSATGASTWWLESSADAADPSSWAPIHEVTFESATSMSVTPTTTGNAASALRFARTRFYRLVRTD